MTFSINIPIIIINMNLVIPRKEDNTFFVKKFFGFYIVNTLLKVSDQSKAG